MATKNWLNILNKEQVNTEIRFELRCQYVARSRTNNVKEQVRTMNKYYIDQIDRSARTEQSYKYTYQQNVSKVDKRNIFINNTDRERTLKKRKTNKMNGK